MVSGGCSMNNNDKYEAQDNEIKERLSKVKHKLLVMSGKGGVGKSSVAAYLAIALAKSGYKTGLIDVDLHGPSIPRLLGIKGKIQPADTPGKIFPVAGIPNLSVISIEFLMGEDRDRATIWRGPIKIGVIRQFIADIEWPELDFLIVDSPPGTGDEPLTVAQTIPDAKAIIVTTPQEISLADVRKSINFCRQVKMEILGIIENMSGLICPHCGKKIDLFKSRGGESVAEKEGLTFLGRLPIEPEVVLAGDEGKLASIKDKSLAFTEEFEKILAYVVDLIKEKE